ncbi:PREDICTED: obscurin-like protein 1, partial [Papilio xuthus]|uniref:Obscurin-like protein 1 n=1 Tax=Papilio xuthus TaxID=66420 RepID=A0AAJ6Z9V8_PAPXU
VRARPGAAAALRCRVLRLADRAVSWIRSSDLQILTHAGAVFTADSRVSAITGAAAERGAGDSTVHTLYIERLRAADSGRYECQINTEPKMSLFFNLTVSEVRGGGVSVRALGPRAVRSAAGGAAALACEARYLRPEPDLPPLRIRWYHAGRLLDDQSPPGGVALSAERWAGGARSRLSLGAVRRRHAGEWTCRAGDAADTLTLALAPRGPADEMEAMQHDQAEGRVSSAAPLVAPLAAPLAAALLAMLVT